MRKKKYYCHSLAKWVRIEWVCTFIAILSYEAISAVYIHLWSIYESYHIYTYFMFYLSSVHYTRSPGNSRMRSILQDERVYLLQEAAVYITTISEKHNNNIYSGNFRLKSFLHDRTLFDFAFVFFLQKEMLQLHNNRRRRNLLYRSLSFNRKKRETN